MQMQKSQVIDKHKKTIAIHRRNTRAFFKLIFILNVKGGSKPPPPLGATPRRLLRRSAPSPAASRLPTRHPQGLRPSRYALTPHVPPRGGKFSPPRRLLRGGPHKLQKSLPAGALRAEKGTSEAKYGPWRALNEKGHTLGMPLPLKTPCGLF